jgi:hypothetical protein
VSQGPWIELVHARNMKFIKSFHVMLCAGLAGNDCCVQLAQGHCGQRALRLLRRGIPQPPFLYSVLTRHAEQGREILN